MEEPPSFGPLLRRHRRARGLSQEDLAERAGMSWRTISDLERGVNTSPRPDTLQLLVATLELDGADRAAFEAAARRPLPALPSEPHPAPASAGVERAAPAVGSAPVAVHAPAGRAGAIRTNLPAALSSFVGREREVAAVRALLAEARLVTLTGSGGVGKTRLALAVGAAVLDQYADGVWLVELASLSEPALVPGTVAQALGVREEPGRALTATLAGHLRDQHLLLVLDNCEHLVAACAQVVSALLRACPRLRILATSREGLAVQGERHWRVPSLSVPDPRHLPAPELAGSYEAVRLFVARAQERQPDFALTEQHARSVVEICARLDGIPLAIELAAARVGVLSAQAIAARLDDRFRLLAGGPRDVPPRQRTLRAALDWSYDLLSEPEQRLLDRLSVFGADGWTLAAAEAVCAGEGVEEDDILDLLGSLLSKSLVQAAEAGGEVRYALLETVRQYAHERLAAAEADAARARHLGWCVALAEEAALKLTGSEQGVWLERLEVEHDNVRTALRWATEQCAIARGLRLAVAFNQFWYIRGEWGEGRVMLEQLLAQTGSDGAVPTADRAAALVAIGRLAHRQGDYERATSAFEEGLTIARGLGDLPGIAGGLNNLGALARDGGDLARAVALYEESLSIRRQLGHTERVAGLLNNLGQIAQDQGDYARAAALYEESATLFEQLGDKGSGALPWTNLAEVVRLQGDAGRAARLAQRGLALFQEVDNRWGAALALTYLGLALWDEGESDHAADLFAQSLALRRQIGNAWGIADSLAKVADVALARGNQEQATALYSESLPLYRQVGDRFGAGSALVSLGHIARMQGRRAQATVLYKDALIAFQSLGAMAGVARCLAQMAIVACSSGHYEAAMQLLRTAQRLDDAGGAYLPPHERDIVGAAVAATRTILGEHGYGGDQAAGHDLSVDQAIAMALELP